MSAPTVDMERAVRRAARSRQRRERQLGVARRFVERYLAAAGLVLIGAWALMLGVGIVRADWLPLVPTINYGTAFLLTGLYAIFHWTTR